MLLEDDVVVGAAEAEGRDGGAAGRRDRALPGLSCQIDEERRAFRIDGRVELPNVDRRRQHLVVQREHGLEQARGAGGALEVAYLRLDRAERHAARRQASLAESLDQALGLGRVADLRRGAVGFDEPDGARREPGLLPGTLNSQELAARIGGGDPLALAVARGAHAADHRVDPLAVAFGVGEPSQHERDRALAHDEAVGVGVEGPAAVGRQRANLGELHEGRRGHRAVDAAGDHGVDPSLQQQADGRVEGRERRGAGRVGGEVGAAQVERVGDAPGDDVAQLAGHRVLGDGGQLRADPGREALQQGAARGFGKRPELGKRLELAPDLGQQHAEGRQFVQLAAERVAEDDRGALGVDLPGAGVAGIGERVARAAEGPLLRHIHRRGDRGRDAKARALEAKAADEGANLRVGLVGRRRVRIVVIARVPALRRHLADAVAAGLDVFPERRGVVRIRKDRGEAHHCDGLAGGLEPQLFALHAYTPRVPAVFGARRLPFVSSEGGLRSD